MSWKKVLTGCFSLTTLMVYQNSYALSGSQTNVYKISSQGSQPNIVIDKTQTVKIAYGWEDKVYYSFSGNQGKSFSKPEVVGKIKELQLAMTRSVQIAAGEKSTLIAATTKNGDIFSFHKTNKAWSESVKINDIPGVNTN